LGFVPTSFCYKMDWVFFHEQSRFIFGKSIVE
jgi:hypothetical protein